VIEDFAEAPYKELSIFGRTCARFGPESDMTSVESIRRTFGLIELPNGIELSELLEDKVDLRTSQELSRYFRDEFSRAEVSMRR